MSDLNLFNSDYKKTLQQIEAKKDLLKNKNSLTRNEIEVYLQDLISIKAHAWAMDVEEERRKMVDVIMCDLIDILGFQKKTIQKINGSS